MRVIKAGITEQAARAADAKVRAVVEGILTEVEAGGDEAVRALSERLDKWSPVSFRLSPAEIEAIMASLPDRTIVDICFQLLSIERKPLATTLN